MVIETTQWKLVFLFTLCGELLLKWWFLSVMWVENIMERRKWWLPVFNPFSTMFSFGIFLRVANCLDLIDWLIEWCCTPLSTVFQLYHGDSSHYSYPFWVSPVLGWGSEVSSPRTLPWKNPKDPVRLEPRTPGLQVKHFTTEPRGTP